MPRLAGDLKFVFDAFYPGYEFDERFDSSNCAVTIDKAFQRDDAVLHLDLNIARIDVWSIRETIVDFILDFLVAATVASGPDTSESASFPGRFSQDDRETGRCFVSETSSGDELSDFIQEPGKAPVRNHQEHGQEDRYSDCHEGKYPGEERGVVHSSIISAKAGLTCSGTS